MPLHHGKSEKAFRENVKTEMNHDHPLKQSLAIAYAVKRRAKKHHMAEGGMLTNDGYQSPCAEDCNDPSHPHAMASGYEPMPKEGMKHNSMAMHESDRMLNQHGDEEEGPEGNHAGKEDGFYAMGGRISPMENEQTEAHEEDMVGRIMKKRQHMYSEGGKVSNNDEPFEYEFHEPNQFDDLVKEDDLESHYTGKNSGDEDGGYAKDDMIDRIMMKRRRQHNPRPA